MKYRHVHRVNAETGLSSDFGDCPACAYEEGKKAANIYLSVNKSSDLSKELLAAEFEKGRRAGMEEAAKIAKSFRGGVSESMSRLAREIQHQIEELGARDPEEKKP